MARRYVRDNRGRFASTGATARGGRLRTAGGGKRQGSTMRAAGAAPAGAMRGSVKRDPKVRTKLAAARQSAVTRQLMARDAATGRGDTASINVKMSGSRGRSLDAEISRNVKAQKTAERKTDRARNRQFKDDQSRAKKLREVHLDAIARQYSHMGGSGKRGEKKVRDTVKSMTPREQIAFIKGYVKANRSRPARAASSPAGPIGTKAQKAIADAKAAMAASRRR